MAAPALDEAEFAAGLSEAGVQGAPEFRDRIDKRLSPVTRGAVLAAIARGPRLPLRNKSVKTRQAAVDRHLPSR